VSSAKRGVIKEGVFDDAEENFAWTI